ncbi:MAG: MFS transporter [Betaproteobacteria bacterium]|nr:MFS transporter [Betaproteobacteria bacterium]
MSTPARDPALAPFRVRSFRFQWPADLAASWAFEMETLILGWYVLAETGSVLMLTLFASLQYAGTLLSPLIGVAGHRLGNKRVFCAMRGLYLLLASMLAALALSGALQPLHVFVITALMGLVRPSDLVMRHALIGETLPVAQFVGAASISRTTQDSARVMGALTGAGLVAVLGVGIAYVVVTTFYLASLLLTLGVASSRTAPQTPSTLVPTTVLQDLKEGMLYVWRTPALQAAIWLALLVNLTAFPLVNGLLPYVARSVYGTDQTGLGYMVAGFAGGALLGSLWLTRFGHGVKPARMMVGGCVVWYVLTLLFVQMDSLAAGIAMLLLSGLAQSLGMVAMAALLLRVSEPRFRSRVMGVRMLAIYTLPVGLMLSGPLIEQFGFRALGSAYCLAGLALTLWIGWHWRSQVWDSRAPANRG